MTKKKQIRSEKFNASAILPELCPERLRLLEKLEGAKSLKVWNNRWVNRLFFIWTLRPLLFCYKILGSLIYKILTVVARQEKKSAYDVTIFDGCMSQKTVSKMKKDLSQKLSEIDEQKKCFLKHHRSVERKVCKEIFGA